MHRKRRDGAGELPARDGFDGIAQRPVAAAAAGEVLVVLVVSCFKIAGFEVEHTDLLIRLNLLQARADLLRDFPVVSVRQ